MNPLGTKVLISVGVTGALGGAGYGIHALTSSPDTSDTSDTLSNFFKKDSTIKLVSQDDGSEAAWTKAHDAYLLEKDEVGLSITDKTINNGTDIKDWCASALTKTIRSTSDLLYRQAKKWCTEFKTISEQIGSTKTREEDLATLDGKHGALDEKIKQALKQITDVSGNNQNGAKLKKWCDNNLKRSYSDVQEYYYKHIVSNCYK
ncbi:hypothetical protein A6V39_03920 [Candidatus Mycoplasma haematobovis]|uniref:Uncharacterized protein n=1 Tax=Candidatus Mycoplasma haematobovis TaxID=432608 RepID=A0A1A9QDK8_9MOLU|nr:hypothetical protein [Candidatus Mycoplasma haematobovis]OAL10035.1 hypothetical protein A6V39_03920 [Candidatus Mycoplasma haematobovis]